MRRILYLCLAFTLCTALLLSGCSGEPVSPETEADPSPEQSPEPTNAPPEQSLVRESITVEEQKEAMKAFLIEHQEEMEEIVAVMMEYSVYSAENEYTFFTYYATYHELKQYQAVREPWALGYDQESKLVDKFSEHPIIEKACILDDEPHFQFVSTDFSHRFVDNDICTFTTYIHTGEGMEKRYRIVELFYCEEEPVLMKPVGGSFSGVEPGLPHWYFYVEYLE